MDINAIKAIIEISEKGSKTIRFISASEAFRKYHWLRNVPLKNVSGNFRGMVVDARWRVVYDVSSKVGEHAGNLLILISIAEETYKSSSEISRILNSNYSWEEKGARLSAQVSGIVSRVFLNIGADMVHADTWFLRHVAWLELAYWINKQRYEQTLDSTDAMTNSVTSFWEKFTVGDEFYNVIYTTINR